MTVALAPTIAPPSHWLWAVPVLDEDADEVLLGLMQRDGGTSSPHYTFTYYPPHPAGEPLAPRPYIPRDPPTPEERERRRELHRRQMERLEQQRIEHAQHERRRLQESWLALIDLAANEIRGTKYEQAMLPDLIKDHATIASWPTDRPFPGHIDAYRFAQQYHDRRAAIDKESES